MNCLCCGKPLKTENGTGWHASCIKRFFGKEENQPIAEKLKSVFRSWLGNGHTSLEDENTVILRVRLTDGVLFFHGTRYDLEF